MDLMKCSERTLRKPCRYCGQTELYWAHDLDSAGSSYCQRCGVVRDFTLINKDGTLHDCHPSASSSSEDSDEQLAQLAERLNRPASAEVISRTDLPPVNGAVHHGADREATARKLADLLADMAPAVDESQVRQIVSESLSDFRHDMLDITGQVISDRLSRLTLPTVVQVEQPDKPTVTIDGAHNRLPVILKIIAQRLHVLMVGPAGTGKSTIADQSAEALGLSYYSISLSPQTPASSILGYMQAAGEYVRSLYREAYEHGGVFHFDEFDNAHPSVLAVINASLANGQMAFPDGMVKRHADFVCVASANTYGRGPDRAYVGRQQIDAATLDRFTVVPVDVDQALEEAICRATGAPDSTVQQVLAYVRKLRSNAEAHKMPLVFSPRASHGMCKLLTAGLSIREVIEFRVRRGISDQDWSKVSMGVATPSI